MSAAPRKDGEGAAPHPLDELMAHPPVVRRLDPRGPVDLLTGLGMESDADLRARLLAGCPAPEPCPDCGAPVQAESDGIGWSVACPNCYDAEYVGDPPRAVSASPLGAGVTRAAAVEAWNERVRR